MKVGSDAKNGDKLTKIVMFRATSKELRMLDQEAKKVHLNRSEFIRSLLQKLGSEPSCS